MNIFGIDSTPEKSRLHLIPVPWEVTTSYGSGTSRGPEIINTASVQVDLYDIHFGNIVEKEGVFLKPEFGGIKALNDNLKPKAQKLIFSPEDFSETESKKLIAEINAASEKVNSLVYEEAKKILDEGKILGLIGGDHSSPLGAIKAVHEKFDGDFAILHFDAHADLRTAYQGFIHSHASIMYNVVSSGYSQKLIQVGIRDFCKEELDYIKFSTGKIETIFDEDIRKDLFEGHTWDKVCEALISHLPANVYISFDIDGLEPSLCPNTGTPVPGGLSFSQATFLLRKIADAKKRVIGFDLNEVSAGDADSEWDANIGARILFKLCSLALATN